MSRSDQRGVSPVVGVTLLVALTVLLTATTTALLMPVTGDLSEPSRLSLSVEGTTITPPTAEAGACGTGVELAARVTLTAYDGADEVYVIASGEGGQTTKTVWADPSSATVGRSRLLANDNDGDVDVDLGLDGGGDTAICPDEDVTLRFYARTGDDTLTLQRFSFE
jgi:FlaG/FlaF family flagellin (archaellin)